MSQQGCLSVWITVLAVLMPCPRQIFRTPQARAATRGLTSAELSKQRQGTKTILRRSTRESGHLSASTAEISADQKRAVIGNEHIQLEITWQRGLRLAHLRNLVTGVDWIPQAPSRSRGPVDLLPTLGAWSRADLWPDLAPPSSEFLLRYTPSESQGLMSSVRSKPDAPGTDVTVTGESLCQLVPERSNAAVDGNFARLNITVALEEHPLEVTLHIEIRDDIPAARRWVTVRNSGDQSVHLHRLTSALLSLRPSPNDLELYWIESFVHSTLARGPTRWRQATRHMEMLGPSVRRTLRSCAAVPRPHDGSKGCMSWLALRDPGLNEGLFVGWEWSGLFDAEVGDFTEGAGVFGLRLGFSDEGGYARDLGSKETFTTPKVFFGFFQGDAEEAGRTTRSAAERLFGLSWPEQRPPMFIGYDTWSNWKDFSTHSLHLRPERLQREIELCRELGVELFILDYGWFPMVGDWRSDPARFPEGVESVAHKVKASGMKFGLWVGFGQAHRDAPVVREHPEFLVTKDGKVITGGWGMPCLCFAYEPCREWALEQICRVVETFGVDWLKHDFELIPISDANHHAPDATDTRIESVEGYYWIMDQLHKRFPKLYLDNWTPPMGGADFGTFQRHHSMLTADDYHPLALRSSQHGITHLFPSYRTHGYLRSFSRSDEQSPYSYRSGGFGCGMFLLNDILQWDQATIDVAKREIQLFKQDRELFLDGEVYNLFPGKQPDHLGWESRFVWSPRKGRGMAQVYRNHDPRDQVKLRFRGIRPQPRYSVEFVDAGTLVRVEGASLLDSGLDVTLARTFTSEVIRIQQERPTD